MSMLHRACQKGDIDVVNDLLGDMSFEGMNLVDSNGNTPLHEACIGGHMQVVEALLNKGVERRIKNKSDKLAIDYVKDEKMKTKFHRIVSDGGHNRFVDIANDVDNHKKADKTSEFYLACRNGDIETAEKLLLTMENLEDIDERQPNGSTALHAACYYDHVAIVQMLLKANASRSVKNNYGCIPYDEAASKEIKDMFLRVPGNNRFASDTGRIDWVLVTPHVRQVAAFERRALELFRNSQVDELSEIVKVYYLSTQLKDIKGLEQIMYFFKQAIEKRDPGYIIKAYTAETGFYSRLNIDLAGGAVSGSYERQCIIGMIIHHPAFEKYIFYGQSYRGMGLNEEDLNFYNVGSSIMVKSFLSTTKDKKMAENFALQIQIRPGKDGSIGKYPAFCTYIIKNKRTALAIEQLAEYPNEREVLIMPYSVFTVKDVIRTDKSVQSGIMVYIVLEECEPFVQKTKACTIL